ncbi:MAG TPA: sigma factor-like helix-turn-helix DNA-binding protein [Polyangiaceae bacterium]|nr:sigma factor-like helix-turn-helix DNA-binding protein [Polyangiaceae bacterium]
MLDLPAAPPPTPLPTPLADLARRALAAHPAFRVPPERLAARLLELSAGAEPARLHPEDIYLALACLEGDRVALAHLERRLALVAEPTLARFGLSRSDRAELTQQVLQRLLVAESDQPPRLATYAGRGPLDGWLQIVVTRLALNARQARESSPVSEHEDWLTWPSPDDDAELAMLKRSSGQAFRQAARAAFGALDPKARLVLRQHLLDGLSAEQIAALYHVHPVTVYRRLRDARAAFLEGTRKRLGASLKLRGSDLDSLLRLLESQLDLSLRQLFDTSA